jgi:MFS family permease
VQVAHHRRDLPVLAAAIGVSALGDWLALLPLNLQLRSMGGSGLTVAALFIAVWSPAALLAVPAGALADRVDRRRLLVAASLAEAAVAVALAFAGSAATILPLAALLGAFSAIATPAEFSLVPAIVDPEGIRRANGWVETARYAGFIGGPALGGVVAAAGGVKAALLSTPRRSRPSRSRPSRCARGRSSATPPRPRAGCATASPTSSPAGASRS